MEHFKAEAPSPLKVKLNQTVNSAQFGAKQIRVLLERIMVVSW